MKSALFSSIHLFVKSLLLILFGSVCLTVSAAEIHGIKDPARTNYYNAFRGKLVVYVPVFMGLPLTEGWSKIMKMQADRLGYTYEVKNANFDTSAGTQILTSLIHAEHKPDVIVVHNPDVTSYMRLEKEAEAAGIYVIQNNMKSLATTTGFAGGDATKIGEMEAKAVVDHCGTATATSHEVFIVIGPSTAPWSVFLSEGYQKALSVDKAIKVVGIQSNGNWNANGAKDVTQIAIQQHPNLCAVITSWDQSAVGAAAAIKSAGKFGKIFVATNGGGNASVGCKGIEDGSFDYYVNFDVPGQARDLNDLIQLALQEKQAGIKPGTTHTLLYSPLQVLTKADLKTHSCWTLDGIRPQG